MMQLIVIAIGGAVGSVLRFMLSNGLGVWLGRSFPFGTLSVNLLGCFLMGLMAEALVLQRVALSLEYRAAILVGVFGGFTTFSSFSLETFYLLEQGQFSKAGLNIATNVLGCLMAVWMGMLAGRGLFVIGQGNLPGFDWPFPYALTIINGIGALLIGLLLSLLSQKLQLAMEDSVIVSVLMIGAFLTLSGLYLAMALLESEYEFSDHWPALLTVLSSNVIFCGFNLWLGAWLARQF